MSVIINITVKNKTTGAAIDASTISLVESGNTTSTNALGVAEIKTTIAFGVTIETSKENFVTQLTPVEFETGKTVYNLIIELMPV